LIVEHGWCAVVNRSQNDINTAVDMRTARANERAFFASKPEYSHGVNVGVDALTVMLTRVLGDSIRRQMPKIEEMIDQNAAALENEACSGYTGPHTTAIAR
jgi:dynamin 1-like protein